MNKMEQKVEIIEDYVEYDCSNHHFKVVRIEPNDFIKKENKKGWKAISINVYTENADENWQLYIKRHFVILLERTKKWKLED